MQPRLCVASRVYRISRNGCWRIYGKTIISTRRNTFRYAILPKRTVSYFARRECYYGIAMRMSLMKVTVFSMRKLHYRVLVIHWFFVNEKCIANVNLSFTEMTFYVMLQVGIDQFATEYNTALTAVDLIFRLDALAFSVIATATWLAGWVAGCHTPVLYQKR